MTSTTAGITACGAADVVQVMIMHLTSTQSRSTFVSAVAALTVLARSSNIMATRLWLQRARVARIEELMAAMCRDLILAHRRYKETKVQLSTELTELADFLERDVDGVYHDSLFSCMRELAIELTETDDD